LWAATFRDQSGLIILSGRTCRSYSSAVISPNCTAAFRVTCATRS